jgi:hypothetical protein
MNPLECPAHSCVAKAVAVACLLALGPCVHAAEGVAPGPMAKPTTVPLEVSAPVRPAAFNAGGRTHLAYELLVINVGPWNCVISGVDVIARGSSHPLASFSQADVEAMTQRQATPPSRVAPETSVILYYGSRSMGSNTRPQASRISCASGSAITRK